MRWLRLGGGDIYFGENRGDGGRGVMVRGEVYCKYITFFFFFFFQRTKGKRRSDVYRKKKKKKKKKIY